MHQNKDFHNLYIVKILRVNDVAIVTILLISFTCDKFVSNKRKIK